MRILIAVAFGFAFFCLGAPPARAQGNPCCGAPLYYGPYACQGGVNCGHVYIYSCQAYARNDWMPEVTLCANCYSFDAYAFAGYCYDGVVGSLQPAAQDPVSADGEPMTYVDAYVRACTGRYVPVRMALALPGD